MRRSRPRRWRGWRRRVLVRAELEDAVVARELALAADVERDVEDAGLRVDRWVGLGHGGSRAALGVRGRAGVSSARGGRRPCERARRTLIASPGRAQNTEQFRAQDLALWGGRFIQMQISALSGAAARALPGGRGLHAAAEMQSVLPGSRWPRPSPTGRWSRAASSSSRAGRAARRRARCSAASPARRLASRSAAAPARWWRPGLARPRAQQRACRRVSRWPAGSRSSGPCGWTTARRSRSGAGRADVRRRPARASYHRRRPDPAGGGLASRPGTDCALEETIA